MKTLLIFSLMLFAWSFPETAAEYVCTPCGLDCDRTVYDKPGACPHCGMKLVERSSVDFKNISFEEVCERLRRNPKAVLLDVRTPGEFNGTGKESFGHFKNAININVDELEQRVGEIKKYKSQEVIVYCSHSHRSPRASYILKSNGFKNVENVQGGVSAITQAEKDCLKNKYVSH